MCLRMKQRLSSAVSRGRPCRLGETDIVTLQFPVQGSPTDSKHLSGTRLVTLNLLKNPLNCIAFQFFQISIGRCRRLVGKRHGVSGRGWGLWLWATPGGERGD